MVLDAQQMETLMTDFSKVLIIQTAFPGDAILTLPLIQKTNQLFPQAVIDVLCIDSTSEIFSASPCVNNVHVMDKRNKHKSIFGLMKFARELKQQNYSNIISPHRSFRSALLTLLLGVKETTGFSNSSLKYAFKNIIDYDYTAHEVKRNLSLITNELNDENWRILPELNISHKAKENVKNFIKEHCNSNKIICIAPGSVWNTKVYPVKYFAEIASKISLEKYRIILIGSKDDESIAEEIKKVNPEKIINACGKVSFLESIELLKNSQVLICNDSAPTHLAMCADIPAFTIYCSTSPAFGFYPYNKRSMYFSFDELSCKPCGIHGYDECPVGTFECAHQLKPEIIIQEINKILN